MYIHTYIHTHTHIHTYMHTYVHTYTHTYICTYVPYYLSLPHNYPCVPPVLEIETNQSGSFTFADADNLFDQLMQTAITCLGSTMIYDLITQSQDLMPGLIQRKKEETQLRKDMEEERRKDIELNDALKSKKKGFIPDKLWSDLIANSEFESKEEEEQKEEGMSFVSSGKHYHPKLFVGSISNIIQKLPSSIQITRVRYILTNDTLYLHIIYRLKIF